MDYDKLKVGENPPTDLNVLIEVSMRSDPVKYEYDKDARVLMVDRFLRTSMVYPGNYGFIPHILADDGDPVDVLVVGKLPVIPGAVLRSRPIGMLKMEDEAGMDEKILAVPITKLKPLYADVHELDGLPPSLLEEIEHFFGQYKALEPGKWAKVLGWGSREEAEALILKSIQAGAGT